MSKYTLKIRVFNGANKKATLKALSVSAHAPFSQKEMRERAWQWAIDNQVNPGRVGAAQFCDGSPYALYASDAEVNSGMSNPDSVHIDIGSHNAGGEGAKTNPALRQTYGSFDAYGKRRFFGPSQNEWAIARGFPFEMENSRIDGGNTPIQFSKTRAYVCVDEDESGEPVVEVWPIRNLSHPGVPNMGFKGWKRGDTGSLGRALNNPTPRLDHWEQASQRAHTGPRGGLTKKPSPRLIQRRLKTHHQTMQGVWANPLVNVKVKSPAQRSKSAPDGRLIARRKLTEKAPKGFYGNPAPLKKYVSAEVMNDSGFTYGLDTVTPVEIVFTTVRRARRNSYISWKLPSEVISNPAFQEWANSKNGRIVCSVKDLKAIVLGFMARK